MVARKQDKSEQGSEISAVQVRMARAALGWGVRDLAAAAMVSGDTVNRIERGDELKPRTVADIRAALEAAGVEFIAENGGGPGVRLRGRQKIGQSR
jgi:transcriptional regulator with XRE-family HTH domain